MLCTTTQSTPNIIKHPPNHRTHPDDDPVAQLQAPCACPEIPPTAAAHALLTTKTDHVVQAMHTINSRAADLVHAYHTEVHAWVDAAQQKHMGDALDASGVLSVVQMLQGQVDAAAGVQDVYSQLQRLSLPHVGGHMSSAVSVMPSSEKHTLPPHLVPPIEW